MLVTAQSTHTGTLDYVYHDSSTVCRQTGACSETHNPKAFFAVSFLSLVVNAAAVIYQFSVIRKNKLNSFKDEIYTDKAFYKKINAENK